ncbi:MAG: STAS domain-containing protein [Sporichthyaceae bacterium]
MSVDRRAPVVVMLDVSPDDPAHVRYQLHKVVTAGAQSIVVDASLVESLPSTAIATMLTAHRVCRRRGGGLLIRRPNRRILEQLDRTGLRHVLRVENTVERT